MQRDTTPESGPRSDADSTSPSTGASGAGPESRSANPSPTGAPNELSEPPTFGLGQIAQIAIPVKDLARAVGFYREALGMRYLFQAQALAFFDAAGVRIMLAAPEAQGDGDDRRSSMIYFTVKDIEHAQRALRARGVHFIRDAHLVARLPDHDLWMAFLEDSEGNALGLMAEVRQ